MAEVSSAKASLIQIAIADEYPVIREGLARLLADESGFAVRGSAASARELHALATNQPPQVLVMDLMAQNGDGVKLLKEIAALAPALRIVVFSDHPEDVYAERCLRAGAHGYVMKRESVATLFRAIREAAAGRIAVSPRIASHVLGVLMERARQANDGIARLTGRELQVFRLAGLALPTRKIAAQLGVSIKTVEAHRENIKGKIGVETHTALIARAAQWLRENQ